MERMDGPAMGGRRTDDRGAGHGAQQNDGRVQLWVTDQQEQLWSIWQTSPGGGWSAWSGPNWNGAPTLTQICACQQGGARGAQFWGITTNGLVSSYQETPGGNWSGWMPAPWVAGGPTAVLEVAAAQQNNGQVQLWVLDQQQQIWSIWQTSPGGGWSGWFGPNWGGSQKLKRSRHRSRAARAARSFGPPT